MSIYFKFICRRRYVFGLVAAVQSVICWPGCNKDVMAAMSSCKDMATWKMKNAINLIFFTNEKGNSNAL